MEGSAQCPYKGMQVCSLFDMLQKSSMLKPENQKQTSGTMWKDIVNLTECKSQFLLKRQNFIECHIIGVIV